ncbi:hypothetical protein K2173_012205 [Erythroxylum novogranatense]|uniref:Uncharacterized protein n=1 Tax=Erythroxylum novogranatense TaxID=1862640 RepID=A0AAV8T970_9ROSI|nr:hypothetical protein K2173_012205 [Erythroxylum novogranatense]
MYRGPRMKESFGMEIEAELATWFVWKKLTQDDIDVARLEDRGRAPIAIIDSVDKDMHAEVANAKADTVEIKCKNAPIMESERGFGKREHTLSLESWIIEE